MAGKQKTTKTETKKTGKAAPKKSADAKTCEFYFEEEIKLTKGGVITKPGSTRNYKTGEWRTFKPTIDLLKCIKCGKCWMVCPDDAIKQRKEDGKFEINHDYCKGCLLCVKECPVKAIPYELEDK